MFGSVHLDHLGETVLDLVESAVVDVVTETDLFGQLLQRVPLVQPSQVVTIRA